MTFLIVTFIIGIAGALGILGFQIWRLKSGAIDLDQKAINKPKVQIDVAQIRRTIWQVLRALVHVAIMQLIRLWAFISHLAQKKWHQWFGYKNAGELATPESPKKESFFLHSISEYKARLKRIKQKLREKDQSVES